MYVDLLVSPFGREMGELLDAARLADASAVRTLWLPDHFSGAVFGAPYTRHPFVCLGAMAAVTERVGLGILVANMVNRHPVQLASAGNSLQSLAPGRVQIGIGSGAAPASRFAVEHEMIGRRLLPAADRRRQLDDYLAAVRAIWEGTGSFRSESFAAHELTGVVDGAAAPPLIVGASSWPTVEIALRRADGVNLRRTRWLPDQLDRLVANRPVRPFEVSVLDIAAEVLDSNGRPSGPWSAAELARSGVQARIVATPPILEEVALQRLLAATSGS